MTKPQIVRDFGQLFMMAFDGPSIPADIVEFYRTFRIGGVILFADNYENPAQLKNLIEDIQSRCAGRTPMFVATDHEGGRVQRFRDGFTSIRPMYEAGKDSPFETERIHRQIAQELRLVGININLSPVADVCGPNAAG